MLTTRGVALVVGSAAAFFGLLGWFLWALWFYDGRQNIDLAGWAEPQTAWEREMMPGARWATDELCGADLPCIQAVTSETLTMYRFAERDQAVATARSFGDDGYLTGWIAVRYEPGALSESQRTSFESGLACINTWVGEQGQDC